LLDIFYVEKSEMYRVGFGFDAHQFGDRRKLILGGIEISGAKGLKGHSDADAPLHAIADAMLGAAALGDLGTHFPDTDPKWKDISSKVFVETILQLLKKDGWSIVNVDLTILAQAPKLQAFKVRMQESIATLLQISPECVSIKATTTDHMGFIGREEGIAAQAVVLIEKLS
jgi:2-C-methyl-D-erythritol 2,4-cyclodiphosphate synthase